MYAPYSGINREIQGIVTWSPEPGGGRIERCGPIREVLPWVRNPGCRNVHSVVSVRWRYWPGVFAWRLLRPRRALKVAAGAGVDSTPVVGAGSTPVVAEAGSTPVAEGVVFITAAGEASA